MLHFFAITGPGPCPVQVQSESVRESLRISENNCCFSWAHALRSALAELDYLEVSLTPALPRGRNTLTNEAKLGNRERPSYWRWSLSPSTQLLTITPQHLTLTHHNNSSQHLTITHDNNSSQHLTSTHHNNSSQHLTSTHHNNSSLFLTSTHHNNSSQYLTSTTHLKPQRNTSTPLPQYLTSIFTLSNSP